MNIAFLRALPIGHAIELSVAIPPDIIGWHVRRRLDAAFPADPLDLTDSDLIYAEERLPANRIFWMPLLDTRDIGHGPLYYYQASVFDETVWQKSPIRSITALARAQDRTTDPLLLLRDRLLTAWGVVVIDNILVCCYSIQHESASPIQPPNPSSRNRVC